MVAKELHVGDSGGVFHVYECGARTTFNEAADLKRPPAPPAA